MVKPIKRNNQTLYLCEECALAYAEKTLAEQCEQWCRQYHSCNLEIIKHAVPAK